MHGQQNIKTNVKYCYSYGIVLVVRSSEWN